MAQKKSSTTKSDAKPVKATGPEISGDKASAGLTEPASELEANALPPDTPDESETTPRESTQGEERADPVVVPQDPDKMSDADPSGSEMPDDAPSPDAPQEIEPVAAPPEREVIVEKRASAIPLVIGGILAGAIGFGASYVLQGQSASDALKKIEQRVADQVAAQSEEIATLSEALANLPPAVDPEEITAAQSDLRDAVQNLAARVDAVDARLQETAARLNDLEKRPMSEGASDTAIAAYERELAALQEAIAAQRAEIEAVATEAQASEENAEEIARDTIRRAALTRVMTALDAGTGFAPALSDLEATGLSIPEALARVADVGVASMAELQTEFPAAARGALAASREAAAQTGEGSGFGAFLKSQLGARSLEPREGSDPDAVLSRAEAAAREGRLTDAIAEIEALPEAGQAEIAEWVARASERLGAIAAAETLGQELN